MGGAILILFAVPLARIALKFSPADYFALGIPGSATDAVLLGAFMLHDLVPGPLLFTDHPDIVYGIFCTLILANIIMLVSGIYGNKLFIKVVSVPESIMCPLILAIAVIGSFVVSGPMFDVAACISFGVIGWLFKRYGFPVALLSSELSLEKWWRKTFEGQ